jgi:hypothetical protein
VPDPNSAVDFGFLEFKFSLVAKQHTGLFAWHRGKIGGGYCLSPFIVGALMLFDEREDRIGRQGFTTNRESGIG